MKRILSMILALCLVGMLFGTGACADGAERTADIVILYTSDIHCGIDQGFGYACLQRVREYLLAEGNDVILVDNGDNIQGEPVGTMTKGEACIELMNKMGYAIAIPGNHEFDYGMDQFLSLVEKAKFEYICCNFNYKGELIFKPYTIRELGGVRVAFVGMTTPETLTTSTPGYFQDEEGNFVYGFLQDETGEDLYRAVQAAVDAARGEGADYVIALGHMGNQEDCRPWTYADIISNTNGIDAFLDGHSHDTDQVIMKNKDGKEIPRSACGTKMECIGWCRIAKDGDVTAGLYTWNNKDAAPKLLGIHNEMSEAVAAATTELNEKLGEVVATTQVELTINDPTEVDSDGAPIRMVRRAETNLGDLCADAYRDQTGAEIGMINGGGVRVSIEAGDITLKDILNVNPFGNMLCVVQLTGQQILNALEWGARSVPSENGGFIQVSGLSYEIHSYIDSPCIADKDLMCVGFTEGERRVKNVLVGGDPIDPEKTYTVAGHNFMLQEDGDGNTCFDGAPLLEDRVKLDNQALIDYITVTLGGTVGAEYADLTGAGRIVIVETAP